MARVGPLRIKLQLFVGDERAFGPGRADVLAAVDREGSISAAGRSLGMSYRFTWNLIASMNDCFREKLVLAAPGGTKGGGAVLTDAGRAALDAYRRLEADMVAASECEALDILSGLLRSPPDAG